MKKMNKYKMLFGFITGMTLVSVDFASDVMGSDFFYQCERISGHLRNLIDEHRDDRCTGDINIAQAYVDAATLSLKYDKVPQALKMLKKGQHELEDLANKSWCQNFAPLVKIDIASITRLRAGIDLGHYED